ncbi:hypothetical protein AB0L41_46375 [Amycolatopsis mediterranei]|uniref:hypothetical protein n=1 Tax=Amycolatopsis mediterranei TaxID=33910 RepID=UPI003423A2F4
MAEWLATWLASRRKPRGGTKLSYSSHIRLWLEPYPGHYRLDALTVEHVAGMFDSMGERNDAIIAARPSDDPEIRKSVRGVRTMGPAPMRRYRATLRAALNAASRDPKINITSNPRPTSSSTPGNVSRPDTALCLSQRVTGSRPNLAACQPLDCANVALTSTNHAALRDEVRTTRRRGAEKCHRVTTRWPLLAGRCVESREMIESEQPAADTPRDRPSRA